LNLSSIDLGGLIDDEVVFVDRAIEIEEAGAVLQTLEGSEGDHRAMEDFGAVHAQNSYVKYINWLVVS
jgi:hypothetical protein